MLCFISNLASVLLDAAAATEDFVSAVFLLFEVIAVVDVMVFNLSFSGCFSVGFFLLVSVDEAYVFGVAVTICYFSVLTGAALGT